MSEECKVPESELSEVNGGYWNETPGSGYNPNGNPQLPYPDFSEIRWPSYRKYWIQSGDVLSQLAINFRTSVDALVKVNHIYDRNWIYAGQYLWVPA